MLVLPPSSSPLGLLLTLRMPHPRLAGFVHSQRAGRQHVQWHSHHLQRVGRAHQVSQAVRALQQNWHQARCAQVCLGCMRPGLNTPNNGPGLIGTQIAGQSKTAGALGGQQALSSPLA